MNPETPGPASAFALRATADKEAGRHRDPLTRAEEEVLLDRPVEQILTDDDRAAFAGRVCLITGAGGSVGAELSRQIAACQPKQLIALDHSELALFRLEQELRERPDLPLQLVLGDVTRATSLRRTLGRLRPDVVFHAAAYKHVTMAERAICATVRVNVLGTCAALTASREIGAQFVFISTDKAAAPRSVMGATKRLAELAVLAAEAPVARPVVVRFGNVLASSGSFVEVMRERIQDGRSLKLTDPDATRFFMSLGEAASLVMKASTIARGGETFWLDMGAPVRVGDLADRLVTAAAARGLPPVAIEIIGLRPGEKLTEQLTSQGITMSRTPHPRIWVARQPPIMPTLATAILPALHRAVVRDRAREVLDLLRQAVPDYAPSTQALASAVREPAIELATPAAGRRPVVRRPIFTVPASIVPLRRNAGRSR